MFAMELHYAWMHKPGKDSPKRAGWDSRFRQTTMDLIKVLSRARFRKLPPLAMGAIWAHNVAILSTPEHEQLVGEVCELLDDDS